jgi:tight adherence protein B
MTMDAGVLDSAVGIALAGALTAMLAASTLALAFHWGSTRHHQRLAHLSAVGFAEMFLFLDAATFLRLNLLAVLFVPLVVGLIFGLTAAALALAAVMVAPGLLFRWFRTRRRRALQRQLPDAASALASALRGGLSLSLALEQIVRHQPPPISQEFSLMLREHRIGVPLDQALAAMAQRLALRDGDLLVSTLAIARDLGSGLAEALERYAASVRRRLQLDDKIRALTAQGRMQGLIMGVLPLLLGGVLTIIDPVWMQPLMTTPIGWITLGAVVVLEWIGFLLIRKIVDIQV